MKDVLNPSGFVLVDYSGHVAGQFPVLDVAKLESDGAVRTVGDVLEICHGRAANLLEPVN